MDKLIFGMPTLIELDSLEDNIALCKELNLDFIEINMNIPSFTNENLLKYKDIILNSNIFYTLHLNEFIDFTNFDSDVRYAFRKSVIKSINIAKELKIEKLVLHLIPGIIFTLPTEKIYIYNSFIDEYLKYVEEFKVEVDKAIAGSKIKICIENTPISYLPFKKQCINKLFESPNFKLTYDIGHDHLAKNKDEDFILENKNNLVHFHIHDCHINKSDHLILGEGQINIKQKLLLAHESNATCVLETKTVSALKKTVEYLKKNKFI
ncbi:MAG: sugar phosphate isomerase/epimerase family protein [Lachnospirales bacterium]